MRKFTLCAAVLLIITLSIPAAAVDTYDADTDYAALMVESAMTGDFTAGQAAQEARDTKINELGLDYVKVSFEDLSLLSRLIYDEAGSWWLPEEWKLGVGEVALNRVASPEFPDTLYGVIHDDGQYGAVIKGYFDNIVPSEEVVRIALRLLEGERQLEPSVVFQSGEKQGSSVHTALYDSYYGWVYFCVSNCPEKYE